MNRHKCRAALAAALTLAEGHRLAHAEIADARAVAARHAGLPTQEVVATLASALHAGGTR